MRKFGLLLAGAVGFFVGSCAGREPYEKLERQLSRLRGKPEVQEVVDSVKSEVNERTSDLTDKVKSKVSSTPETQGGEPPLPRAQAAV